MFFLAAGMLFLSPWTIFAQDAENPPQTTEISDDYFEQYRLLIDTIDQVDRNYVDKVGRRELIEAAIHGVMKKLDPYSDYIAPTEMDRFRTYVDSKFGGIGVQINSDGQNLVVVAPLIGTPAYDAGVFSGDVILAVDDRQAENMSLDDAVMMMKGEIGTPVKLTLLRPGKPEPFTLEIFREIIHLETVFGFDRFPDDSWNYWLDEKNGIAYIQISSFGNGTAKELKRVLETLGRSDTELKALILDLRFNPGGILPVAVEICDMFVREGRIVSIKGRNTEEQVWDASPEKTLCGVPMAVLINHYSASASEILAACLQDHGRAVLVGERSWGKGSVQNVMEMENGASALKLTTAGYYRPNGKNIHRGKDATDSDEWGVSPEEKNIVPLTVEQLNSLALDQRRRQELLTHKAEKPRPGSARPQPVFEDPQLRRALELMQKQLGKPVNAQNLLRARLTAVPKTAGKTEPIQVSATATKTAAPAVKTPAPAETPQRGIRRR